MRKKIVLVYPSGLPSERKGMDRKLNLNPPLGILSVGTVLDLNGYDVKLLDLDSNSNCINELMELVKENNCLFIGFSVTTSQINSALKISRMVKLINKNNKVVWGGIHPSLFPAQTCGNDSVDIVVTGEGESTALELADRLSSGQDISNIQGIVIKKKDKVLVNPKREFLDIATLPPFKFDLVDIENYIHKDMNGTGGKNLEGGPGRRSLPVLSGLGCRYSCAFCINTVLRKKRRLKTAESIIGEITRLIDKYQINDVPLIDEDFFEVKDRVIKFLELIEKNKLKFSWHTNIRANYFSKHYLDENLLKRMSKAGCFHLGCGGESGSQKILDILTKGIRVEQIINAAVQCKKAGINTAFSFITGIPGETKDELLKTIKLCSKLMDINSSNSYLLPQVFRPYPGSKLFDEAVKMGLSIPDNLEGWCDKWNKTEGYYKLEELPWIKDHRFIRLVTFYLNYASSSRQAIGFFGDIAKNLLSFLSRLRLKLCFFKFPWEYYLLRRKGYVS
jgi:anaerobic magnesium-protoporphyrin IX monomethyl ester cyclase